MQIEITYIFHNCFVVKLPDKVFLFDYPGAEFLNAAIRETVISLITGTNLYVFSSHFHQDHFNRDVTGLGLTARHVNYVLSKDIVKKNSLFKNNPSCLTAAPDQTYQLEDLEITTFRSNDEGVAFLIQTAGVSVYFGGDLANWAWEDNNRQEKRFLEEYFGTVLQQLQERIGTGRPIQIAFSNTDARLKNWTGAAQFIEAVQPRLFIPMHTFGHTDMIAGFLAEHPQIKTPLFQYQKTGDTLTLAIDPPKMD